MITEDYVSFEVAKLLKENGFDEPTLWFYVGDGTKYLAHKTLNGDWYRRPTLQTAMKWLREEKDILIEVHHLYRKKWNAIVSSEYPLCISVKTTDSYYSYEEACENAIKYVLENLI